MNLLNKTLALAITALALQAHAAPYQAIVPAKSSVTFSYKQMGVAVDGRFKKFAAQLNFDPAKADAAKASFDVELASVDAGSSEADDEVVTKSWFNAAAFPKATFVAKQFKQTAPNQYEVSGTLTIKGQTREVKFPMKHSAQGKDGVLTGGFTLKRGDFNIGEGMWTKFDVVANDIQVNFSLTATQGK
ncbi:polyisoprenoid-binding protein [Limnohabitans sp. MMS-10A-160]|jgi:polyisoprenoid-binding protein YceI|uniref:YceI family protein n=1 Tax=unclassified Limnohabitans TaxID=2626134 RepID=UPI000D38A7AC|nr:MULTISPECIES: YceI family protein [unclassified Limnohabitans]PUE20648.1 polyisoprenoid-binding protein [Limnohabitans sp. MMS-10A-192]PUE24964.1 polyisoprenoid-binding protein [Limnohabitans sp. MMS-10A-160]